MSRGGYTAAIDMWSLGCIFGELLQRIAHLGSAATPNLQAWGRRSGLWELREAALLAGWHAMCRHPDSVPTPLCAANQSAADRAAVCHHRRSAQDAGRRGELRGGAGQRPDAGRAAGALCLLCMRLCLQHLLTSLPTLLLRPHHSHPSSIHPSIPRQALFAVIGTPCWADVAAVQEPQWRRYLHHLPGRAPTLYRRFAAAGEAAVDLLARLLAFDPTRRCSPDEALAHEYFSGLSASEPGEGEEGRERAEQAGQAAGGSGLAEPLRESLLASC